MINAKMPYQNIQTQIQKKVWKYWAINGNTCSLLSIQEHVVVETVFYGRSIT